jgi:hypothetical protein
VKERDVVIFLGEATAQAGNSLSYPVGQRHAALLFMRQEHGTSPDWPRAKAELERKGWSEVNLAKASPISVEALSSVYPHALASYEDASKEGFSVLIFSEPIDPPL